MEELEEKGQTLLSKRTPISNSAKEPTMCTVDGCLHKATVSCGVTVANTHLVSPDMYHVPLCETHLNAFDTLKWKWRRTPTSTSSHLSLDGVFAADTLED